ncbi:MAG: TRAP transporter small permease subunit [Oscillospiraceae bacterium]|nr:TRAP transporter small permease subunit [Oscillospiraceae bacterium]
MKKLLEVYRKVDDVLALIIKHFCAILLAAMIAVCFVNTVGRYAFHHSFRAAEEIVILCAVWVTCVGASLTARADDHVTLDLLQELIKNHKVRAVLYALTRLLACAFLLLLLPAAFEMVKIYSPMKLTGTKWPQWVLYDSYVVGSIAMILGYLRITPGKVIALWNGTEEKSEYEKINEHEKALEEGKVEE